jgi:hypothetical protein
MCVLCHRLHKSSNWKYSEYETISGKFYGWFCEKWFRISPAREAVPQRITEERNKYAKSMLQPYREGTLSQEFVEAYGTKHLDPKEVKHAKRVWKDTLPSNWQRSK